MQRFLQSRIRFIQSLSVQNIVALATPLFDRRSYVTQGRYSCSRRNRVWPPLDIISYNAKEGDGLVPGGSNLCIQIPVAIYIPYRPLRETRLLRRRTQNGGVTDVGGEVKDRKGTN